MKTRTTVVEHLQVLLCGLAGAVFVFLSIDDQSSPVLSRITFGLYGIAFSAGTIGYYAKPKIGAFVLLATNLSLLVAAPVVGFPVWVTASGIERCGLVVGVVIAAGLVSGPLFRSSAKNSADPRR